MLWSNRIEMVTNIEQHRKFDKCSIQQWCSIIINIFLNDKIIISVPKWNDRSNNGKMSVEKPIEKGKGVEWVANKWEYNLYYGTRTNAIKKKKGKKEEGTQWMDDWRVPKCY